MYAQGRLMWDHDNPDDTARLSREATGVPLLQKIIGDFPADGRWQTLNHHINVTWRCTMQSLEMSATVSMAQRKAHVDEQITRTRQVSVRKTNTFP